MERLIKTKDFLKELGKDLPKYISVYSDNDCYLEPDNYGAIRLHIFTKDLNNKEVDDYIKYALKK